MKRSKKSFLSLCALCLTMAGMAQTNGLGIFTNEESVGQTPPGCKSSYDPGKGEYRVTGGGANVWGPVEYVSLHDPVYVGLAVCSHVATTVETAVFSNVKLEQ
jgi:hypothetical protein